MSTSPPLQAKFSSPTFQNIVLVAAGVSESWLSQLALVAHSLNKTVAIVGLHHDFSTCKVDFWLSDLSEDPESNLLIIPQGDDCMKRLLVDPRVHGLMGKITKRGGRVAFASGGEMMLSQVPAKYRVPSEQIYFQKNLQTNEFAELLFRPGWG